MIPSGNRSGAAGASAPPSSSQAVVPAGKELMGFFMLSHHRLTAGSTGPTKNWQAFGNSPVCDPTGASPGELPVFIQARSIGIHLCELVFEEKSVEVHALSAFMIVNGVRRRIAPPAKQRIKPPGLRREQRHPRLRQPEPEG